MSLMTTMPDGKEIGFGLPRWHSDAHGNYVHCLNVGGYLRRNNGQLNLLKTLYQASDRLLVTRLFDLNDKDYLAKIFDDVAFSQKIIDEVSEAYIQITRPMPTSSATFDHRNDADRERSKDYIKTTIIAEVSVRRVAIALDALKNQGNENVTQVNQSDINQAIEDLKECQRKYIETVTLANKQLVFGLE